MKCSLLKNYKSIFFSFFSVASVTIDPKATPCTTAGALLISPDQLTSLAIATCQGIKSAGKNKNQLD